MFIFISHGIRLVPISTTKPYSTAAHTSTLNMFWEYACQHRHGSTNTFINWSTLANYEFELPDIADTRWERKRDSFIKEVNEIVPQLIDSDFESNNENDLELDERGYYIKKSEKQAGKNIRYCAACYQNTGKLFPITQGSMRRDFFCTSSNQPFPLFLPS